MARPLPILAIIAAVLAALSALVFVDTALALAGLFAVGAGIFVAISRDLRRMIPGILAAIFGILGLLGVLAITTEDTTFNLGISATLGQAFVIVACLEISGAILVMTWHEQDPEWKGYLWGAVWLLAFVFAFVFKDELTNQAAIEAWLVGLASLALMGPAIAELRQG